MTPTVPTSRHRHLPVVLRLTFNSKGLAWGISWELLDNWNPLPGE